jgi:acyl-coenzyme A thioesterase PaaI-like protein
MATPRPPRWWAMSLELVGSAAVNDNRDDRALNTASLRVNFLRQFRSGPESRYVGTPLRVGRSSGVAEAQAVGGDGEVAIIARLTAYLG